MIPRHQIHELHREFCLTVVMVTHDLDTLLALCDRVAVLADRKIIVAAPIDEVMAISHPFIQSYFLGEPGRHGLGQLRPANPPPSFSGSTSP